MKGTVTSDRRLTTLPPDTGCALHPTCITCPYLRCLLEEGSAHERATARAVMAGRLPMATLARFLTEA